MAMSKRVKLIGIGGPSCSGKTTLAKHLRSILEPHARILHQDDFAPPADKLPIHPVHQVQDWDDPEGAIEWPKMAQALRYCKDTGDLPPELKSHDSLNVLDPVPVRQDTIDKWRRQFAELDDSVSYILCDGFILFWEPTVFNTFDVKFFIRESYSTLKTRRENRNGYFTATQSGPAGDHWQDPPGFWDNIVWPAFLKAHRACFVDGNVEEGKVDTESAAGRHLRLLDAESQSMDQLLERSCQDIWNELQQEKA